MHCALYGLVIFVLWEHLPVWFHPSFLRFVYMWPFVRTHLHNFALLALCHPICTFVYMFMHASLCVLICVIKLSSYDLVRVHTVFDTQDPESLLGTLFDDTCVVHTPILWNYGHQIQTYILSSKDI